ncbi:MAG: hypothetical protein ACOCU8_01695 [Patescibacteria group bacterium]
MDKNIEVELRGPLSQTEFEKLNNFFKDQAEVSGEKERILIDYSTFLTGGIENRNKDIRLRVTNGKPEIIIKLGNWGGSDIRKELSVFTMGEFDILVQMFAELGYIKGMLCVRKSKIYKYKEIEFALVEVPGHSYYYEAEKMTNSFNSVSVLKEIEKVCLDLELDIFNQQQFFDYIKKLNKESNEVFDYSSYTPGYFKKRFNI